MFGIGIGQRDGCSKGRMFDVVSWSGGEFETAMQVHEQHQVHANKNKNKNQNRARRRRRTAAVCTPPVGGAGERTLERRALGGMKDYKLVVGQGAWCRLTGCRA